MMKKEKTGHKTRITKLVILQQTTNMSSKNNWKAAAWTITFSTIKTSKREEKDKTEGPPKEVIATPSSRESQTLSIGIGEYGIKAAGEENLATFF